MTTNLFDFIPKLFIYVAIAFSIICGVFCGKIADKKGRDPFLWFGCGFLINLAGVLFALIIEPNHKALIMYGQRRRCPFCAEVINVEAVKCPHCTADLPEFVDSPENKLNNENIFKKCPLCGELIREKSTFCPHCARDLPPEKEQTE